VYGTVARPFFISPEAFRNLLENPHPAKLSLAVPQDDGQRRLRKNRHI
jgi:hypothetical protein